jgi:hypothetical protein
MELARKTTDRSVQLRYAELLDTIERWHGLSDVKRRGKAMSGGRVIRPTKASPDYAIHSFRSSGPSFRLSAWLRMRKKRSHAQRAIFVRSAMRRTVFGIAGSRDRQRSHKLRFGRLRRISRQVPLRHLHPHRPNSSGIWTAVGKQVQILASLLNEARIAE